MKNGYRAAPILVALAVLMLSVIGSGTLLANHGSELGDVSFTAGATPATGVAAADVDWATTDPAGGNLVFIHLHDQSLAAAATTTVTVSSDGSVTDITVVVTEVAGAPSTFTGRIMLHPTTTTSTPSTTIGGFIVGVPAITAEHGDAVTVTYNDATSGLVGVTIGVTDKLTADIEGPSIDDLSPADGEISGEKIQTYSVDVVDEDSGVDETTIEFVFGSPLPDGSEPAVPAAGAAGTFPPDSSTDIEDADEAKIGVTVSRDLELSGKVFVTVRAFDTAGNETVLDIAELDDTKTMAAITIDTIDPDYEESFTGVGWDNIDKVLTTDDANSIIVIFSDNLTNLDADSIVASDFSVEANTVLRADVFDNAPVTSTVEGLDSALAASVSDFGTVDIRRAVFLTLEDALAPDESPSVTVVGDGIADAAGNAQTSGSSDALDRIAPTLTIDSVTPGIAADGDEVVIQVSSDEVLDNDEITVTITNAEGGTALAKSIEDAGTNEWEITTSGVGDTASFSIFVVGVDEAENVGSVGADSTGLALPIDEDALADDHTIFEGDTGMPAPRVTPADAGEPVFRDPFFITIDFGVTSTGLTEHEGDEYSGDSHATVTLTDLTLDGANILGQEDTKNSIRFLVAINDIALGEHTVTVNAEDDAGNSLAEDLSVTFTVIERPSVDIDLEPGWNLISFPGDPSDGSIDAVFAGNDSVTAVVTYDPARPGGFLSAIREEDGSFAGTLSTITADRGYWINTDSFEIIEADIPGLEAGQVGLLPPTIPISEGWNLVPVRDVVGTGSAGDEIVATVYLASIVGDIAAVYFYDTIANTWEFLDIPGGDSVVVGKAYWVYTTAAGVLVPAGTPE